MHEEAPEAEMEPTAHEPHTDCAGVPVYRPAAQVVQTVAPFAEYLPVGQSLQVCDATEPLDALPAAQVPHPPAPPAENLPPAQVLHAVLPSPVA